jgi:hypothetical protein
VHRLLQAYDQAGAAGLVSKKRSRPSNRRHSEDFRNAALDLIRERYLDFGPTLAREKLIELHHISVAKETLRQWMTEAGIWVSRRERKQRVLQPRAGAIVSVSWFRSMGRITGGSRTAVPNAPCWSTSMTPLASCCICGSPDQRTLSITRFTEFASRGTKPRDIDIPDLHIEPSR